MFWRDGNFFLENINFGIFFWKNSSKTAKFEITVLLTDQVIVFFRDFWFKKE